MTTKRRAEPGVLEPNAPLVRDHRDLPQQLDVFGARLRAARIPFRVHATQTGFSIVIRGLKDTAKLARRLARAWIIWQGTREVIA